MRGNRLVDRISRWQLYVVARLSAMPRSVTARLETLRPADLVLAEDTPSARKLLDGHGIGRRTPVVLRCQRAGACAQAAALLRTARALRCSPRRERPRVRSGLPGRARGRCRGARVVPVPGPSAVLAALVGSGLPLIASSSWGFPRARRGARQGLLAQLALFLPRWSSSNRPIGVAATLADLVASGQSPACLCGARAEPRPTKELCAAPWPSWRSATPASGPLVK